MSTVSRAAEVAEVLWELKRADKVATYSLIAGRAGFSAGSNGRSMTTCLRRVRKDWPHLQWWRAINDQGLLEKGSEQEIALREAGFEIEDAKNGKNGEESVTLKSFDEHLMTWESAPEEEAAE